MKRFLLIVFCAMFALAGMAQNLRTVKGAVMNENDEPMSGVTVKAVNSDAETVTDKSGRFELKVDSYVKYVEASFENYITARAEIDGSYIVFNLKVDKQLLKAKAKAEAEAAEAEAKRAAEQAKAEQAKAEVEAKRAAEQAKAEQAKAEAEAKRLAEQAKAEQAKAEAEAKRAAAEQAKAEAEAKRLVEKAAAEQAKPEAEVERAAETVILKAERNAIYSERFSGYNSMVEASVFSSERAGINYIGGYRFNNYLFAGAGVGAEIPFGRYILFDHVSLTRGTTFPVFAHVRANFLNRRCSPFFALSAGARFMIPQEISISMNPDVYYKYNYISAFVNPQLGVNFRVTPKTSIYLSVGVNGYTEEELSAINYYQVLCKPRYFLGFDLHLGVTF